MTEFLEEEEESPAETITPVPSSQITQDTNPAANGWYEYADDDTSFLLPIPTSDTTPVEGKTYYTVTYNGPSSNNEGVNNMSETAIAYSTYQTYLMYKTSSTGTYAKVVDIKDYPDMLGDPNLLDCTTLSHGMEMRIPGILQAGDGYPFTANYTPTNFSLIKNTLSGHQYWYALYLGGTTAGVPDGHNGKFE